MKSILFIIVAAAVFSANGDQQIIPVDGHALCVHCSHPMDWDISDNIMKQAMRGLVSDNGPNYILVRTNSGKSTAHHIYGPVYNINADFKVADSDTERNCNVLIIPTLRVYSSEDINSYGEAKFRCENETEIVKKLRFGSVQYPRN